MDTTAGKERDQRMKTCEGNPPGPAPRDSREDVVRRRGLLAKIHIAAKDLAISEPDYRGLLAREFGVRSAADLSTNEMERLLARFTARGWRPTRGSTRAAWLAERQRRRQAFALQVRAREIFSQLEDSDERRLRGLCEKICDVGDLALCGDVAKLKRLLAVLKHIRRSEEEGRGTLH
jgi:hypothetical protein